MDKNLLHRLEAIPLSDEYIYKFFDNNIKIITYDELKNIKSIDDIVEPYKCCIILYYNKGTNIGHWCALIKNVNGIEFFNPYGKMIDSMIERRSDRILSRLLKKCPYDLYYCEYDFQKLAPGISTCGRHCIIRCFYKQLDENQYNMVMNKWLKILRRYGINNYDEVVTVLTC